MSLLYVFLAQTFSVHTSITRIHLFSKAWSGYYVPDIVLRVRNKAGSKTKSLLSVCLILVG